MRLKIPMERIGMVIDVLKKVIIGRAVSWLRMYNPDFDMAVFVNDHIGGGIITFGLYDRQNLEMTPQVLAELAKSDGFRDGVCLDIGANIGNHALYYSKLFKQVIAFEPNPIIYKLLEANILRNRISNIKVCTMGLGSKKERKNLSICDENLGMSSLVQVANAGASKFDIEIEINIGDDVVKEMIDGQSRITYIKIDVEGFEADALKGLSQTIQKYRPVISIELNFLTHKEAADASYAALKNLGYRDFYILERPHSFNNRYINLLSRMIFGEKPSLTRLIKYESVDYQQVFCVASPADAV